LSPSTIFGRCRKTSARQWFLAGNFAWRAALIRHNSVSQELLMASSSAEDTIRNLMDKGTYDRLEKDLSKVKSDISSLADQLSEALSAFTGTARKQARRGYRQARANVDTVMSDVSERGNAAMEAAQDAAS